MENKKHLKFLCIIWGIAIILGVFYFYLEINSKKIHHIELKKIENLDIKEGKTEKFSFYLLDNKNSLEIKEVEIPFYKNRKAKIKGIIKEVCSNLKEQGVLKREDIEIYNVYFVENTLYVDLSKEILDLKKDTKENVLGIYSIVNSLTNISGIKKVKILVESKEESGNFSKIYERNINL